MPVWRLQTAISADSLLPRDVFTINPVFNDHGLTTDPQNLCQQLADGLSAWMAPVNSRQIVVKAYDAQGTRPVFPQGRVTKNPNLSPGSQAPRELAVCLSFYSGQNIPRRRGRLYIPVELLSGSVGARPSDFHIGKVAALAPILAGIGGADVDWCVYSEADGTARTVDHWWVDDEFDAMRSRGLRSTKRTAGTTSG